VKRLLLVVLLALAIAPAAAADEGLDRFASTIAMRPVHVNCPTREEWNHDYFAQGTWGYTFMSSDETWVAPLVCGGALHEADSTWPAWQRALGALVITHESYHLRLWTWRGDEGRVECAAIRHFKVAVQLLGGSRADADFLLPYALALHWRIAAKFPEYDHRACKVPNFWHTL
jgi:hypothetical protein